MAGYNPNQQYSDSSDDDEDEGNNQAEAVHYIDDDNDSDEHDPVNTTIAQSASDDDYNGYKGRVFQPFYSSKTAEEKLSDDEHHAETGPDSEEQDFNDSDSSSSERESLPGLGAATALAAGDDNKKRKIQQQQASLVYDTKMYSTQAVKMMKLMGHTGEGLGKAGQGILEPVTASTQKGRTGLGFAIENPEQAAAAWDPNAEVVELREPSEWLVNDSDDLIDLTRDILDSWIAIGKRKLTIDDETKFCNRDVLQQVLCCKNVFDKMTGEQLMRARSKCNPFEEIRQCIFLNRAAVKMANMDARFDYMFTSPVDEHNSSLIQEDDLLYFADVCAGPGGFSEYVLFRKNWLAKGFGFTLRAIKNFELEKFLAGSPVSFDPYYGVNGDGDVFNPDNITSFADYVLKQTKFQGVHFMMADGGFSVEGQENIQEILSKQLYLCQCLVALSIVREKGHFVCKLFDLFTPFTVGLVYLMYKCFERITIFKPNTSRPANSERYLICKWKKSNTDTIQRHLFEINQEMFKNQHSKIDTLELVPHYVLENDEKFFKYIVDSNNLIGENQIIGLKKIAAFYQNSALTEPRQIELKEQSLKLWNLPNKIRKDLNESKSKITNPDELCRNLLNQWADQRDFLSAQEKVLQNKNGLDEHFRDVHDWYFVALDTTENIEKCQRTIFLGHGGRDVVMYHNGSWTKPQVCIELSPNTLVYGEIVKELQGEGKSQTQIFSFHIIDGLILGGIDIRNYRLKDRIQMCQKFAKSLNKPRRIMHNDEQLIERAIPIRCKQLFLMTDMKQFFDRLQHYKLKNNQTRLGFRLRNDIEPERFFVPRGLLFLKDTKEQLQKLFSKTQNRFYYYDYMVKKQFFPESLKNVNEIYASFRSTYLCRRLWKWEIETQVWETYDSTNSEYDILYRSDLADFITRKILQ